MVAAPAVEVTLGSLSGLETGRTTLYLDTAQHTFAQAFPFFFLSRREYRQQSSARS